MMKTKVLSFFLILISANAFSQQNKLSDLCQIFHLPAGRDTTTFIVFGNEQDLKVKKPLFLFRQGSQPMPLIHIYGEKYYMPVSPFRFRDYKDKYHFVMISKPGVRLIADSIFIQKYQQAIRDGDSSGVFITTKYIENNYREKYVEQCNQVIKYLVKQPWVDSEKVVFCGGSEGFTVGADLIANWNKSITHAILFSGNTEWRFENLIYNLRQNAKSGNITANEAQSEISKMYQVWEEICKDPESTKKSFGDSYRAWYSFSVRNLDNLLKIKIPLYVAYGTDDREIAANMDMLPVEFELAGKKNLTFRPYLNHDHQFFKSEKDSSGIVTAKTYNGDAVAKEWMEWLDH